MNSAAQPAANVQMLFRVPVERVFEAFIDPVITTQFWFTHSDGRLEPGKTVHWEWRTYGCATHVNVLAIEENERILIEWGEAERKSKVEWKFAAREDGTTLVEVTNSGFSGSAEERVAEAIASTGGFTLVLANAKALLEYNIHLNLIHDRFPDGHVTRDQDASHRSL